MAELEELAATLPAYRNRREAKAEARAKILTTLPRGHLQIAGALYIAQRAQCFHCGGPLPIFGKSRQPGCTSKEHALPAGARIGEPRTDSAFVLAHRLCNGERGERAFTSIEWQRAAEIWTRAIPYCFGAPQTAQTFMAWTELGLHMVEKMR